MSDQLTWLIVTQKKEQLFNLIYNDCHFLKKRTQNETRSCWLVSGEQRGRHVSDIIFWYICNVCRMVISYSVV